MRALSWSYNLVTRGSRGENAVQFLDERRRRLWCRDLLGGVVFLGPSRLEVFLTHWSWVAADGVGYSVAWQAKQVLPSSRGGVRSFGGGWRLSYVCRLWLLAADRDSWCCLATVSAAGTASKDGACGIGIMGRLGLQRTVAGCSAWLGYSVRYIVERWRK